MKTPIELNLVNAYSNSYYEAIVKLPHRKTAFIRVRCNDNFELTVDDIGLKSGRQKQEKYLSSELYNDFTYRRLSGIERKKYQEEYFLKHVPAEVLEEVLNLVWENMKPKYPLYAALTPDEETTTEKP